MPHSWTNELKIGMPMEEVVRLLGKPDGTNPGSELLGGKGKIISVGGDLGELRKQLSKTLYCVWRRPEGMYMLVFFDGRLAEISSASGYVKPKPTVRKGAGIKNVCAKCGRTEDEIRKYFDDAKKKKGVVVIESGSGFLMYCTHCKKAFCGRCQIDLGFEAGCPECEAALVECGLRGETPDSGSNQTTCTDIVTGRLHKWESPDWLMLFGGLVTNVYSSEVPLFGPSSRDVAILFSKRPDLPFNANLRGSLLCHQCAKSTNFTFHLFSCGSSGATYVCQTPGCHCHMRVTAFGASDLSGILAQFQTQEGYWLVAEPETSFRNARQSPIGLHIDEVLHA
jgi:hypothetical protein